MAPLNSSFLSEGEVAKGDHSREAHTGHEMHGACPALCLSNSMAFFTLGDIAWLCRYT